MDYSTDSMSETSSVCSMVEDEDEAEFMRVRHILARLETNYIRQGLIKCTPKKTKSRPVLKQGARIDNYVRRLSLTEDIHFIRLMNASGVLEDEEIA